MCIWLVAWLPQRLKSMLFEIFSTLRVTFGHPPFEKISNNVDFRLWGKQCICPAKMRPKLWKSHIVRSLNGFVYDCQGCIVWWKNLIKSTAAAGKRRCIFESKNFLLWMGWRFLDLYDIRYVSKWVKQCCENLFARLQCHFQGRCILYIRYIFFVKSQHS